MALHKNDPSYTYQGKKFPHDCTHNLKFTTSVGHLIPVLSDLLYPGDHVKIKPLLFSRMADLETAAFTRLREHIEYFFVPLNQIISSFPQFIYGVGRNNSALIEASGTPCIPTLDTTQDISALLTGADMFGITAIHNAKRLLDMCGYSSNTSNVLSTSKMGVNVLPICAYHKAFFDYYAIQDRTHINPHLFNLDDCIATGFVQFGTGRPAPDFFSLHYRPYMHDYYTDMKVSPLESFASFNANANLTGRINNWLGTRSQVIPVDPSGTVATTSSDATTIRIPQPSGNLSANDYTTANIRAMFAVDKLLEITRRSKKDYSHQTLAHFGSSVNEGISGRSYKIGSITQELSIQDVDATAASTDASSTFTSILGQQGGKGVTDPRQQVDRLVDFTAPCHGILIGIYSAEPVIDYPDTMINKLWTYKNKEDFFTPEFDHLGMQPIFGYELNASTVASRSTVYGWQYRYQESKQKFNRITTGFTTSGLSSWTTVRNALQMGNSENAFYISPYYLDPIMLVSFDQTDYGTDPLRHSLDQIYYKSSVMSNFSLPQLSGNH